MTQAFFFASQLRHRLAGCVTVDPSWPGKQLQAVESVPVNALGVQFPGYRRSLILVLRYHWLRTMLSLTGRQYHECGFWPPLPADPFRHVDQVLETETEEHFCAHGLFHPSPEFSDPFSMVLHSPGHSFQVLDSSSGQVDQPFQEIGYDSLTTSGQPQASKATWLSQ